MAESAKSFKVLDNPQKKKSDLAKIRDVTEQQLKMLGSTSPIISEEIRASVRKDRQDALVAVVDKYGMDVPSINVDNTNTTLVINVTASSVSLNGLDCYHSAYLSNADSLGLNVEWLGKSFVYNDSFFTVNGLDTSRMDKPYLRVIRIVNGERNNAKMPISDKLIRIVDESIRDFDAAFAPSIN